MVLGYNYSNKNWWQQKTNVTPLLAILIGMVVHQSDMKRIARCSMSRAIPEATGCCHWATTHSALLPRLPWRQTTKQQWKIHPLCWPFDDRCNAAERYRAHCPTKEVSGFSRSHWTLPSGELLLWYYKLTMPTPVFCDVVIVYLVEKGLELTCRPL